MVVHYRTFFCPLLVDTTYHDLLLDVTTFILIFVFELYNFLPFFISRTILMWAILYFNRSLYM